MAHDNLSVAAEAQNRMFSVTTAEGPTINISDPNGVVLRRKAHVYKSYCITFSTQYSMV